VDLDDIQLKIDAAQVDLHAKTHITANHSASEVVATAQHELYEAADAVRDLKKKLKSNLLTGTYTPVLDATTLSTIFHSVMETEELQDQLEVAGRNHNEKRMKLHTCKNISRRLNSLPPLPKLRKLGGEQRDRDRSERLLQERNQSTRVPSSGAKQDDSGAAWHTPDLLSAEEIARMADPASGLAPCPPAERVAAITARASFLYNKDVIKVCAVCDHQAFDTDPLPWRPARHKTMLVSALPGSSQFHLVATDPMDLHEDLREQYNVSKLVPVEMRQYVSELLLSPRGMGKDGHITVCTFCHSSLMAGNKPKFSIANGSTSSIVC
jgi:hypothetical protein